jgi:preprotein translocase subunit SecG
MIDWLFILLFFILSLIFTYYLVKLNKVDINDELTDYKIRTQSFGITFNFTPDWLIFITNSVKNDKAVLLFRRLKLTCICILLLMISMIIFILMQFGK